MEKIIIPIEKIPRELLEKAYREIQAKKKPKKDQSA